MNKAELAAKLSEMIGEPKAKMEKILEAFTDTVMATLKSGGEVTIAGFGSFSAKKRAARMGVNPQNPSQKIHIPEVTVPKFRAGKALKDSLKS